jgi:hypothetical protein
MPKAITKGSVMRAYLLCFLCCLVHSVSSAQEIAEDASTDEKSKAVHAWADRVAGDIQVRPAAATQPGKRVDRSLIRWSNPIVGDVFGDCYLWTDDDIPIAFLSVYAFYGSVNKRRLTFQSLSEQPLVAERNGVRLWEPKSAGIRWLDLRGLPIPGATVAIRQRQMKAAANSFAASISQKDDPMSFRKLRLLTQPLFTFERNQSTRLSGAVYAFVDGTDPELLLLIECTGGDRPSMRVAPARQNHRRLRLDFKTRQVWEAPQIAPPFPNPRISDPSGVYYNATWKTIADASDR